MTSEFLWLFSSHGSYFFFDHNDYLLKESSRSGPFIYFSPPPPTSLASCFARFSRFFFFFFQDYCSSVSLCSSPHLFLFHFCGNIGVETRTFFRLGECPASDLGNLVPKLVYWAAGFIGLFLCGASLSLDYYSVVDCILCCRITFIILGDEFYHFCMSPRQVALLCRWVSECSFVITNVFCWVIFQLL